MPMKMRMTNEEDEDADEDEDEEETCAEHVGGDVVTMRSHCCRTI